VVPGDISTRTSVLTAAATHVLAGVPVQLTLLARDAAGNDVAQGGRVVTFVVLGTQPSGSTSLTTDDGTGTYRATYIGAKAGSDTIVALIEGTKVAQSVTIAVEPVASQRSNR
jgi:hypothetical protein